MDTNETIIERVGRLREKLKHTDPFSTHRADLEWALEHLEWQATITRELLASQERIAAEGMKVSADRDAARDEIQSLRSELLAKDERLGLAIKDRDRAIALREDAEEKADRCVRNHSRTLSNLRDEVTSLRKGHRTLSMRVTEVMSERDHARSKLEERPPITPMMALTFWSWGDDTYDPEEMSPLCRPVYDALWAHAARARTTTSPES